MENILLKTENSNISDSLSDKFIYNFNKIFKYKNINIDIIGTANNTWFNGKNILIDGLEYTEQSAKCTLKRLDDKFKNSLYDIQSVEGKMPHKNNENKTIYINEAGLYYVIIHCTKDFAKGFQDYILFELLPYIRQIAQNKYLDIIHNQKNNVDELTTLVKQQTIKIDNISIQNKEQTIEILKLNKQNNIALNKLQELGINLLDVKDKLDTVIVDRNIKPKDTKRQHKYLLLKNKSNNNEFKFIRAQDQYIKTNKSIWLEKYNIIIEMDKTRINNLKNKNKYKQDKKALKDKIDNREPFIEIKGNNFILNRCDEDKFINIVKSIENEQYKYNI
ncbi:N1R/p28-like protein [Choristoneura rosaceana entomopoxvirus 'L']|uniref:N1R/p28-like protein n=1 Tax=Choristoneura rosaceana entomopoxvirus 'L' TaxID=1293539 RepID=A0ABM9QKB5_9POXV|nr:N1R/p28-like protein [Choristoneura rosaceana entomopoxvirus 'L']CCU55981.1 N1R/p28-like protein [Choristoneura rosaceana entomopoxvirus 'L']